MIVKYTKFSKLSENKSVDYYDMFEFNGGGARFAVEHGWVDLRLGDKEYQFDVEESDDFFNVFLSGTDEEQKELEELGLEFDIETGQIKNEDFKDFIYDMYQQAAF